MGFLNSLFSTNKKSKSLGIGAFSTIEEAQRYYSPLVREELYKELFYTIRVRCKNCLQKGTFRLWRGTEAEGGECPFCDISGDVGLTVLGKAKEIISYTPIINEEAEQAILDRVEELVKAGMSEGIINKPGSLFT